MTVWDLALSITHEEMFEWLEWFKIKDEAEKKARDKAKQEQANRSKGGGRRRR